MRNQIKRHFILVPLCFLLAALFRIVSSTWFATALAQVPGKTAENRPALVIDRPPVRVIEDNHPTFNAIAMDMKRSEVFLANSNEASNPGIFVYPMQFPPSDKVIEPRRIIAGANPGLGQTCGLAVSPEFMEVYAVEGDGGDLKVFPLDGNGDIRPSRTLSVAHGSGGIFLDVKNDELIITTEHVNKITVYRRGAGGEADPLRNIQGPHTELADPHGVYVDNVKDELYVTNHGNYRETQTGEQEAHHGYPVPIGPSTGKFLPPSVTVYPRTAEWDVRPLRTIQGSKTGLNLPQGIAKDPASGQIVVANTGDNSVLFFAADANGNVAPVRVLKGPATKLRAPTGMVVDTDRNELWVSNWENHLAAVFPRMAQGDVAPLRYIRAASADTTPASFGRPGTVAFDPKRKQILIAN
jgi:DNA-binding beta-propeller fold protein YncE